MSGIKVLTLCALLSMGSAVLKAKPTFVFDIHGVLLREDLAVLVKKKIEHLTAMRRATADSALFQELCAVMEEYRPLGSPTESYTPALGVPYEVYVLFAGIESPKVVHEALISMLEKAPLAPSKRLALTALVEAIFDNDTRISALTVIPTGASLFQSIQEDQRQTVLIYTNAPTEWIAQYKTLFPSLFANLPAEHFICSGATGMLKPSQESFNIMCNAGSCDITDIVLIDDKEEHCAIARNLGATGVHFLTPTPALSAS